MPRARRVAAGVGVDRRGRGRRPSELAIAVRSSSGMNTSVERVRITSAPELLAHQALEPQRHVEHEVLLLQAAAADGAGVVAAVAGVDHDPAGGEAELAGEAVVAGAVRGRRLGRRERRRGGAAAVATAGAAVGRRRRRCGRRAAVAGAGQAVDARDRRSEQAAAPLGAGSAWRRRRRVRASLGGHRSRACGEGGRAGLGPRPASRRAAARGAGRARRSRAASGSSR